MNSSLPTHRAGFRALAAVVAFGTLVLVARPSATFGARLPDGPFRDSKEDVAVKFITSGGSDFTFTLRRGLIDAYQATVDSVVASLKK